MKAEQNKDVLSLFPEVDMVASRIEELRNFFVVQLESARDVNKVILDVDGVNVVDSLGVNLIIGLYREANSHSRIFMVKNAGPTFIKVANFFRFASIFEVHGKA